MVFILTRTRQQEEALGVRTIEPAKKIKFQNDEQQTVVYGLFKAYVRVTLTVPLINHKKEKSFHLRNIFSYLSLNAVIGRSFF